MRSASTAPPHINSYKIPNHVALIDEIPRKVSGTASSICSARRAWWISSLGGDERRDSTPHPRPGWQARRRPGWRRSGSEPDQSQKTGSRPRSRACPVRRRSPGEAATTAARKHRASAVACGQTRPRRSGHSGATESRQSPNPEPARQGSRTLGCLCRVASVARHNGPAGHLPSWIAGDRNVAFAIAPRMPELAIPFLGKHSCGRGARDDSCWAEAKAAPVQSGPTC